MQWTAATRPGVQDGLNRTKGLPTALPNNAVAE